MLERKERRDSRTTDFTTAVCKSDGKFADVLSSGVTAAEENYDRDKRYNIMR